MEIIIMEEYKMLREEIMFNLNKLHWYISIVSTVSIALFAYIIKNPNDIILLSLFLATLVILEGRIHSVTESNIRISTYMEVFLEPNLENIKWETYSHYKINKKNSHLIPLVKNHSINFITEINTVCLLIGIIAFVFNVIIIYRSLNTNNIIFSILNLLFIIILGYMAVINGRGYLYRDDYIKHWEQLKEKLQNDELDNMEAHINQQNDSL